MNERNIEVAKRLGYHIYHYDKDHPEHCYYQLWKPTGMEVDLYPDNEHKTEAEAWQDAPKWDNDLNLALELVQDKCWVRIETGEGAWLFSTDPMDEGHVVTLAELPGVIVDWFLVHVDVKALERKRKAEEIRGKIADLQDELAEIENDAASSTDGDRA